MSLSGLKRMLDQRTKDSGATRRPKPVAVPSVKYDRPTLVVSNSFCELHQVPAEVLAQVAEALTYKNEAVAQEKIRTFRLISMAKSRGNRGLLYKLRLRLDELDEQEIVCWLKGNRFPTGLLAIVKDLLAESGIACEVKDTRKAPSHFNNFKWWIEPPAARYYQAEMVALAKEHGRGVLESAVGTGKSLILTQILKDLQVNSLIVVPSIALLGQLQYGLERAFGKKNICTISTASVRSKKRLAPLRLTTVQTLAALRKKGMLQEVISDIDLIAVDEIHHAGSKSYTDLLPELEHVYYRFGFTGTFLRNDCKTLDMWGFLSNRLYSYPAWKATEEGFLTPVEFVIHTLPGKRCQNYQKEYSSNYCGKPSLLEEIAAIMEQVSESEQVLILVDRTDEAGLVIHEYLKGLGIENAYISGDDKKDHITETIQAFNRKEIRRLVGSTIIGEGVDLHSTDQLILARGGKSEIAIVQAIGRAIRLSPGKDKAIVHDFRFSGTKFLEKHLGQRLEIYRNSFGGEITEQDV